MNWVLYLSCAGSIIVWIFIQVTVFNIAVNIHNIKILLPIK